MLKLYIQDNGVYGCLIAIHTSEVEAKKIMIAECAAWGTYFDHDCPIEEYEIKEGFSFVNLGDS